MVDLTLNTSALPVYSVDSAGNIAGPRTYSLASAATLAAGASTPPVAIKASRTYAFNAIFSGTSPSVKLQFLAVDGSTWLDAVTLTASASQPIDLYAGAGGASVRVTNAGTNQITGLTAALVS